VDSTFSVYSRCIEQSLELCKSLAKKSSQLEMLLSSLKPCLATKKALYEPLAVSELANCNL